MSRCNLSSLIAIGCFAVCSPAMVCAADAQTRPNTDWFQKAGYGIFVHYLDDLQNNAESIQGLGKHTAWDACVKEFDTEKFASDAAETGAGYVVFTIMQLSRSMIAPNATFDRISGYAPGEACATRDLIEDLYQSLNKRNIKLLLYWTGDGPRGDEKAKSAYGYTEPVSAEFVKKWADTFREYGERYGDKIAGVWCDGCYSAIGYDDEKLRILSEGLHAGSSKRIVAMNPGVDPEVRAYTRHEDFTCGEQNVFREIPIKRFLKGEQWHILSYLSKTWWGDPGVGYPKNLFADYVFDVTQRGGVVSVDVLLFRDGGLDRSQIEALKAVRKGLQRAPRQPIPPGNLAYRKPAGILSLDGGHSLQPNGNVHYPQLGVDGNLATMAQGSAEWAWTYEVDLLDTVPITRAKIHFGSGYATQFELRVSTDGKEWRTVASQRNGDGKPYEAIIDPVKARYVRVCGLKPDGENQPGSQMSIAELEVYQ